MVIFVKELLASLSATSLHLMPWWWQDMLEPDVNKAILETD